MPTKKRDEIVVFISGRNSTCGECEEELGKRAWIRLDEEKGALCLACADLDHLLFLPAGDATLTRRAKKYSGLWTVVLEWSRHRKQYERQGLLVEEAALNQAEEECFADADVRELRRQRDALRRADLDEKYVEQFAEKIQSEYPNCAAGRAQRIAEHACKKHSGRVGRSAAAKELDPKMVELAVIAHIRHAETNYDELLMMGHDRYEARQEVAEQVAGVLTHWRSPTWQSKQKDRA